MKRFCLISCLFLVLTNVAPALALVDYYTINGTEVAAYTQGAPITLSDAPDYEWWYGCSPTAAGMMMGYYDRNGYDGLYYSNLVPGGTAELTAYYPDEEPDYVPSWDYLAQYAIASPEHVDDFYSGGYGAYKDDVNPAQQHDFNCLADFMGTNQWRAGNTNGATTFWFYTNGAPLYAADVYNSPTLKNDTSGMFGLWEYVDYCGYGSGNPSTDENFYNQYIDTLGLSYGFTFADYMAEIDAGGVVMIHVEGHSMLGYGYDADTETVYLHDTWYEGEHTMTWGGTYPYGDIDLLQHYAVTCFTPTGGVVPVPGTVILLGSGLIALVGLRRRVRVREGDG